MASLTAAALFFAALHLLVSGTRLRDALVARLGERRYTVAYSLASVAGLTWLIWAYGKVRVPLATPLFEYRAVAAVLVFIAFVFMLLGLLVRTPTMVGGESLLAQEDSARGIHRVTRHPLLWGIALWSVTHIAFNTALPHLLFFGTFLLVALVGTASIDAKRAYKHGAAWLRYTTRTSNVPFAAILQGRNRLAWRELGVMKLLAATGVFAAFAALHARLFGVPPF